MPKWPLQCSWVYFIHQCGLVAFVKNALQVNWLQRLTEPHIQAEHLSDAFTQNVCFHHDKTKQKMRICFSWSHHSPDWLNLSALFSLPLETERIHIFSLSVHLDCKEGESRLSSFWMIWSRHRSNQQRLRSGMTVWPVCLSVFVFVCLSKAHCCWVLHDNV